MRSELLSALLLLSVAVQVSAQVDVKPSCGAPPSVLQSIEPNIFTEQQEQWLGEAMADQLDRDYRPVKDAALNAYLKTIGDRLLGVLPATKIQFHFQLVDSSDINGFSLAGGRVYLTRKLVASAHSEDEIAGVIAHEMGHILSHQFAIETTADLRRLLNVPSVSDRADIYDKFQRLVDAREHQKHQTDADTDDKQDQADRVAVYAAAAAGYRPQAYAEFWNRSFFVGGKTGNRISDFLGSTKPSQKRLRRIQGIIAELPPNCGAADETANVPFQDWQRAVLENQAAAPTAISTNEVQLTPALRLDIDRLRFSRDGKYILAQDESSIFLLSREPFKVLFRFDADRALPADFTPDSQRVSFLTRGLHVEEWSISQQKLISAHEVVAEHGCFQANLSPDGRTIACANEPSEDTIGFSLLDVETGKVLFEKKAWFTPNQSFRFSLFLRSITNDPSDILTNSVSKDGNVLVIGPGADRLAFDLRSRAPIKLEGALKSYDYPNSYAFTGNDTILAINRLNPADSGVFSFPEGKRISKAKLAFSFMYSTTNGQFVITAGPDESTFAIADINLSKYRFANRSSAMDVFDDTLVNENIDGSLLLRKLGTTDVKDIQRASLPLSPLAASGVAALSPDGRYLALSSRKRGALWDVSDGKRLALVRGFHSPWWTSGTTLIAEFPPIEKDHPIVIAELTTPSAHSKELSYKLPQDAHLESGHLLGWKSEGKKAWTFNSYSASDASLQWSRHFDDGRPGYTTNSGDADLIFSYLIQSPLAKEILKNDAALRDQAAAVKEKTSGRLIELVDSSDGSTRSRVVVEVPRSYEGVGGFNRVGDLLYLSTGDNRTIVYSLRTGAQLRQFFGYVVTADQASELVCVANRRDEMIVFDRTGAELQHLTLGSPLRFARFLDKGAIVAAVTADQRMRRIAVLQPSVRPGLH